MKMYILLSLLGSMFFSEAFASGGIACDLEATVKRIQAIGVLDETVSLNRSSQEDTFRYIATLDVTSSVTTRGIGTCPTGEQLIELKQGDQVKVGDQLSLEYSFVHDRPGSWMTYKLK